MTEEQGAAPEEEVSVRKQRETEFIEEVTQLDARGQRVVANMLAGAAVKNSADKLTAGDVDVLSGGVITQIKRKDVVREGWDTSGAMRAALRLAGIDETFLATCLQEGLRASKTVVLKGRARKQPDYAIRIRYLELAHRLRGDIQKDSGADRQTESYEERIRLIMNKNDVIKD